MTSDEFKIWLKHHQAAFPGLAAWFGKISEEIRKDTIELWKSIICRIDLDSAIRATDTMLAESDRPRFYEDHPAAILTRAKRDKPQERFKPRTIIDGEETYRCLTCSDAGVIICWHPVAMRHYRDHGNLNECGIRTCVKACTCAEGDQYDRQYGRFNRSKWIPYEGDEEERISRLRHYIENAKDSRRERAFDAFGG